MASQSKLSKQAEELKSLLRGWIPKRKATVSTLRALADKLLNHHNNVRIAQVAGSSTSIAGFGVLALGFGLSFVTGGMSLVVAGIGGAIGIAGGLTNTGSTIAETCIQREIFDTAQKTIDEDREATEAIGKLWEEIGKEAEKSLKINGVKVGFAAAGILKGCAVAGYQVGVKVGARAVSGGGGALFRGLSVAGKAAHIGGFAFSAVLLPLDIYTLVTNSMEIDASRTGKEEKEPKAVKKLRELADELETDMPDEGDLARKLDDFLLKTTAQAANPLKIIC